MPSSLTVGAWPSTQTAWFRGATWPLRLVCSAGEHGRQQTKVNRKLLGQKIKVQPGFAANSCGNQKLPATELGQVSLRMSSFFDSVKSLEAA